MKLLNEFDAVVESALSFPNSGALVQLKVGYEVRRFQLRRFRYSVFAAIAGDELLIFGVSHHKREPGYWVERLANVER